MRAISHPAIPTLAVARLSPSWRDPRPRKRTVVWMAPSNDLAFYCRRNLFTRSASRQASAPGPPAYPAVATPG